MAKMPAHRLRAEALTPSPAVAPIHSHQTRPGRRETTSERARFAGDAPVIRGPASGRMVSSFTLPDPDGHAVSIWSYRQRLNLVLFFHHGSTCLDCRELLRELAASAADYREEEAAVLAIGPDRPPEAKHLADSLACPFPILSDPSGHAIARQGLDVPSVVISDRFGEIWAAWTGDGHEALPPSQEIRRWLEFVELQCPECSAPEWPPLHGIIMD